MSYEDTNRELRIRQRSLYKMVNVVIIVVSLQFAMLGLVLGGVLPPISLVGYSGLLIFVGFFMVKSIDEDSLSRRVYEWYSDNPAPIHELDVLKKRTRRETATDGGDREDG
jgi:hypothetical protein